jgi:hypothetical protein
VSGRFASGRSGNPAGRPRKAREVEPSAFDVIIDRSLEVSDNGQAQTLSVEEAHELKTYQEALRGSRMAQREILKMIERREAWLSKRRPAPIAREADEEYPDQPTATPALLILGIAAQNHESGWEHLLEPWAVEMALTRRRPVETDELDIRSMSLVTRDGMALRSRFRA